MNRIQNQALAIAALIQACYQVAKIARTGIHPQDAFEANLTSLFAFDADEVRDIFGGIGNLVSGLRVTLDILEDREVLQSTTEYVDILRYFMALMKIERRLDRKPAIMSRLAERLRNIQRQADHLGSLDPLVIENLAVLYREVSGEIDFPIQVNGERNHLQNSINVNKIRALLLSGIRAAVLYRQLGGRRWHLLFFQTRLKQTLRELCDLID